MCLDYTNEVSDDKYLDKSKKSFKLYSSYYQYCFALCAGTPSDDTTSAKYPFSTVHCKYKQQKCSGSTAEPLQFTVDSSDPLRSVSLLTAAICCAPYSGNICCVDIIIRNVGENCKNLHRSNQQNLKYKEISSKP